ncbi:hypothetical protein MNB_ARC-1_1282 [hydrothermal vent metagenome]|uniref:Lcl C-terminal domain-containing protein n=1 Tax=hydrothermal vent metagenome TaxID=652676 RepID=A0A3B1DTX7_9ZZZZ
MKKNIVSLLLLVNLANADFIRDNQKEVVVDTATNLMWQDSNETNTTKRDWSEALSYCESLDFAGYSDWHLPNINELFGVVDISVFNPAMSSKFKSVVSAGNYWSSTTVAYVTPFAWSITFNYGQINQGDPKTQKNFVRCFRVLKN